MNVTRLAHRIPFFYGWVVVGCAMCATFARQSMAVATLSVFIVPMTASFGWSRTELAGAVSLGGILAAVISPLVGMLVDRHGARVVLMLSTLAVAGTALALSATHSLLWFYVFFSLGRMLFASPFDLAMSAAVANWFLRRRAQAMSLVALAAGISLAAMPFIAQVAIDLGGWRSGWITVAAGVLAVGALPNALLMVRRPEDVGLTPDGEHARDPGSRATGAPAPAVPDFGAREALRTPALWLLMTYSALVFLVQAGISLHQAPHMVQRGVSPTIAASIVSTFALVIAVSGLAYGYLASRLPVRFGMALAAVVVAAGAVLTLLVRDASSGYLSATVFGLGIGGLVTLVPVAFADYFGRASYGTIRGLALPAQVGGQAAGPLLAGVLFDLDGNYDRALMVFAGVALGAAVVALGAVPPHRRHTPEARQRP